MSLAVVVYWCEPSQQADKTKQETEMLLWGLFLLLRSS